MTGRRRDPYALLGVRPTATRDEIAHAYRTRAKQAHPDIGNQPTARMEDLNWAWNLLSDTGRRAEWDRTHGRTPSANHWAEPEPWQRPPVTAWERSYTPPWTVSGEPWDGAGAPATASRSGIGCLVMTLLLLILAILVMFGGFLSGYESPGGESLEQSTAESAAEP